jgi:predicted O-methyltransferase YrrM
MQGKLHDWSGLLKRILPKLVWEPIRSLATCILAPIRFSVGTGHAKSSFLMQAVDRNGNPIPWYTYPAIDFLAQRNYQTKSVLEFGSGQSTFWWASRAKFVLSIEENVDWFSRIRSQVPSNVEMHHIIPDILKLEQFMRSRNTKFDVIIVDGNLRRQATALSFEYLKPGGALILDNADGFGLYDEIRTRDCKRIDFYGFAPGVVLRHCTSIVFVEDCFLLAADVPIPDLN